MVLRRSSFDQHLMMVKILDSPLDNHLWLVFHTLKAFGHHLNTPTPPFCRRIRRYSRVVVEEESLELWQRKEFLNPRSRLSGMHAGCRDCFTRRSVTCGPAATIAQRTCGQLAAVLAARGEALGHVNGILGIGTRRSVTIIEGFHPLHEAVAKRYPLQRPHLSPFVRLAAAEAFSTAFKNALVHCKTSDERTR